MSMWGFLGLDSKMSQARRIARMDKQLRRLQSRDWRPAKFRAGKPLTRPGESGQSWDDVMSPLRPRMLGHLAELERMKSGCSGCS